jgi:hypothetical protein
MFAGSTLIFGAISAHAVGVAGVALAGALLASGLGVDTVYSTGDLDNVAWIDEHDPSPYARVASACLFGQSVSAPVVGGATPLAARCISFGDDWYNRIHFWPNHVFLDVGAGDDTVKLTLWNAWFVPRSLISVDVVPDVLFSGNTTRVIPALGVASFTISAGAGASDGEIEAAFVFDYATLPLPVTVNVEMVWNFSPNWEEGVLEKLTWATDILQSETLVEQRRALRQAPRREFEAAFILDSGNARALDIALFAHGAGKWIVPIWPEVQTLQNNLPNDSTTLPADTANRSFRVGAYVMLVGADMSDYAIYSISAMTPTVLVLGKATQKRWSNGARIFPAVEARLSGEPAMQRLSADIVRFDAGFIVTDVCDVTSVPPAASYRGYPVLEIAPDESEPLSHEYGRLVATLDSGLAATAQVINVGGTAMPVTGWRWFGAGIKADASFRALLYWLSGRWRALWVPSFVDDFQVIGGAPGLPNLTVAADGFDRHGFMRQGRRDVRLHIPGAPPIYARIIACKRISNTVLEIMLSEALPLAATPDTKCSFLTLSRADSDSVEILHHTDVEGVATADLIFRGVRDDEF